MEVSLSLRGRERLESEFTPVPAFATPGIGRLDVVSEASVMVIDLVSSDGRGGEAPLGRMIIAPAIALQ